MILSGRVQRVHGCEPRLRAGHPGHSLRIEGSRSVYAKICLCDFSMLSSGGIMVRRSAPPHVRELTVGYRS